jgi:hypothetical protein
MKPRRSLSGTISLVDGTALAVPAPMLRLKREAKLIRIRHNSTEVVASEN